MPLVDADALLASSASLARQADELSSLQAQLRAQAERVRWNSPAATGFDHALEALLAGIQSARTHLAALSDTLARHAHTAQGRSRLLNEVAQAVEHPTRIVAAVASLL